MHQQSLEAYLTQYIADVTALQRTVEKTVSALSETTTQASESSAPVETTPPPPETMVRPESPPAASGSEVERVVARLEGLTEVGAWLSAARAIMGQLKGLKKEKNAKAEYRSLKARIILVREVHLEAHHARLQEARDTLALLKTSRDADDREELQADLQDAVQKLDALQSRLQPEPGLSFLLAELTTLRTESAALLEQLPTAEKGAQEMGKTTAATAATAAQRKDLEARQLVIQTNIEALNGVNDLDQWATEAADLLVLLDAWIDRSDALSDDAIMTQRQRLQTSRGDIHGSSALVSGLNSIPSTLRALEDETDITTRPQAAALLMQASDLQLQLDAAVEQLLALQNATAVYKALLKWLEMEGISVEQEKDRFRTHLEELVDQSEDGDLTESTPVGQDEARIEHTEAEPDVEDALSIRITAHLASLNQTGEVEAWSTIAADLTADLETREAQHALREEDSDSDRFADLDSHIEACRKVVSTLPDLYTAYRMLAETAASLTLEHLQLGVALRDARQLERALTEQLHLLGKRNQETAAVTGMIAAASSTSRHVSSLVASLSESLSGAEQHAELVKAIELDHDKILQGLTALAQLAAPDVWKREALKIIDIIDEWDDRNERRQDGVLPQDTDSLHEEKRALEDALESVAGLIGIEESITEQESACQIQVTALTAPALQEILSGLEKPTIALSTIRSSLETFARRLHLHRSLAAMLGKTAALRKRIDQVRAQAQALLKQAEQAAEDRETTADMQALYGEIEASTQALSRIASVDIWRSNATALEGLLKKWASLNDTLSTGQTTREARLRAQELILHKGSPRLDQQETLRARIALLAEEIREQTAVSTGQASELQSRIQTLSEHTLTEVESLCHDGEACPFANPFVGFITLLNEQPEILRELEETLRMQEDTEARREAARATQQAEMAALAAKIESTMTVLDAEGSAERWSAAVTTLGRLLTEWAPLNTTLGDSGDTADLKKLQSWRLTSTTAAADVTNILSLDSRTRILQDTARTLTGAESLSALTNLRVELKRLRTEREGCAAIITSLCERDAPLRALSQTNSSAVATLTGLIEVASQAARRQQDTITSRSLDADLLALATSLEHLPPLSNEESWVTAAGRARLKAEAWLRLHETISTPHPKASWVEQWPGLLEIGADKAPRLSAITDELLTHQATCSDLESTPDAAQVAALLSALPTLSDRLSAVETNLNLIQSQSPEPDISFGLRGRISSIAADIQQLFSRASSITDRHAQRDAPEKVESHGLTSSQLSTVIKTVWSWHEQALAPRATQKEVLIEDGVEYNVHDLWIVLKNTPSLKQDLNVLLNWTRSHLPNALRSEEAVQKMIKDAQKNG
ncbi:MAG: hypothetical protein P8R54_06490 [Myxococcota bacterium]|nr:hypothetical protein [Myxococcota bacterium]